MESHRYEVSPGGLARAVLPPLAGLVLLAVLLRLSDRFNLLPPPQPMLDPDKTTLLYKREVSRSSNPAEILLIGDSSCMMGVDAPQLSRELHGRPSVLNLGLIISMGLDVYANAMTDFFT